MTVLDLSNHDYPTFDPGCLAGADVTSVIVGCWDLEKTLDIVRGSRAVGIEASELYTFLYPGLAWELREVTNALSVFHILGGIRRVWLDCESQFTEWPGDVDTEAPGMTVDGRLAVARYGRKVIEDVGAGVGIYTGESWWRNKMGNSTEFSDLPLWLANYGSDDPANPRPPITTVNFGGWSGVYRHQYSSTIVVCGRNRDHNYEIAEGENDVSDIEDLILATFAGVEERDEDGKTLPRDQRLVIARARMADRAGGAAQSVNDAAASAASNLADHVKNHAAGISGPVADHTHEGGKVKR